MENIRKNGKEFIADTVLMVRPSKFCTNIETKTDNKYMVQEASSHQDKASEEFNNYSNKLYRNTSNVWVELRTIQTSLTVTDTGVETETELSSKTSPPPPPAPK